MQLFALFLPFIPISALIADKNRRKTLVYVTIAIGFLDFFLIFIQAITVWLLSFMHRYGFDGIYLWTIGYILIGIISYYGAVFRCVINV
jgi:hypothetical protein